MAMLREAPESPPLQDPCLLSPSSDEVLVAEMLMRLSQPQAQRLSPPPPPPVLVEFPPLRWGLRQKRSRQVARSGSNYEKRASTAAGAQKANAAASPTTPLSWSGTTCGTSFSGGGGGGGNVGAVGGTAGDGSDSTSRCVKPVKIASSGSRLKVAARGVGQFKLPSRRVSKKKTPVEWKEEVNSLSVEKMRLEKELERLEKHYRELKGQNENLNKLKLNLRHAKNTMNHAPAAFKKAKLEPDLAVEGVLSTHTVAVPPPNFVQLEQLGGQICLSPLVDPPQLQEVKNVDTLSASCMLPDLNIPLDEDYS